MGLFRRPGSPYWWMHCPRGPGQRPIRTSTRILADASTAEQRKKNRQLAEQAFHAQMGDLARERFDLPIAPATDKTLGEWIAWYRQHITPTHRGAERELVTLTRLARDLGQLRLRTLTRTPLLEWMTARQAETTPHGRPVSPATVNREIDILKRVLAVAVEHAEMDASPLDGMPRLHAPTPKRRVMTVDEEARLLAAMRQPAHRALLILALDTLARLGDCLDVRWQDIHDGRVWFGDPKVGSGYYAPITARLQAALDAIPRDGHEYVWWRFRLPETATERRSRVAHMLRRACERCDPPIPYGRATGGLSWHWATRRTAATRMILAGAALPTVQRAGRWKSARVVADIYLDTEDALVRAAVESVGADVPVLPIQPRQRPRPNTK